MSGKLFKWYSLGANQEDIPVDSSYFASEIACSADGRLIVTAQRDNSHKIFNSESLSLLYDLTCMTRVTSLAMCLRQWAWWLRCGGQPRPPSGCTPGHISWSQLEHQPAVSLKSPSPVVQLLLGMDGTYLAVKHPDSVAFCLVSDKCLVSSAWGWRLAVGLVKGTGPRRHFFHPRDWINFDYLHLAQITTDSRFLCPHNGEVAVVHNGLSSVFLADKGPIRHSSIQEGQVRGYR